MPKNALFLLKNRKMSKGSHETWIQDIPPRKSCTTTGDT